MVLFILAVIATMAGYFLTGKNMTYTWCAAAVTAILYFIYKFSK